MSETPPSQAPSGAPGDDHAGASGTHATPPVQRIVAVAWPSFLVAGLATVLFFTLFDPLHLDAPIGVPVYGRLEGYSLGFFAFWAVCALSSALTTYFLKPVTKRG